MAFKDDLAALKAELKAASIPVDRVLAIARVNRSTWTRWGNKHQPRLESWINVRSAADRLIAERRDRAA